MCVHACIYVYTCVFMHIIHAYVCVFGNNDSFYVSSELLEDGGETVLHM